MTKPDYDHVALLELRGGCQCMHPPYRAPCWACETPPTDDELLELGHIIVDEMIEPDFMKAVRDLCR